MNRISLLRCDPPDCRSCPSCHPVQRNFFLLHLAFLKVPNKKTSPQRTRRTRRFTAKTPRRQASFVSLCLSACPPHGGVKDLQFMSLCDRGGWFFRVPKRMNRKDNSPCSLAPCARRTGASPNAHEGLRYKNRILRILGGEFVLLGALRVS